MTFDASIAGRAERLKAARAARYPSAAKAAEARGLSPVTVRAHESGQNGYPLEDAIAYARLYRVSLSWLLTGEAEVAGAAPPGPEPATVTLDIRATLPVEVASRVLALIRDAQR